MANEPIKILLVEDNPGDAVLIEQSLRGVRRLNFTLSRVGRLAEIPAALQAGSVDLMLLDLNLPDSFGLDTVRRAVGLAPGIAIVVLTGMDDEDTGLEAMRLGAQDFLMKSDMEKWALVRSIRHAIERQQAQQALQNAHDELEKKVEERTAELQRLNQVLQMVTACNQALVRATDEPSLLLEICQIILDVGGYRMAWVGFAENGPDKKVIPVASVGFEDGYLERANISWADNERGRGPTGKAIRTGQIHVGRDFLSDHELALWREEAIKRDFRSSVAVPLSSGDRTIGAVTFYAAEPEAFDEKKIDVLKQLADDLAFGITALRTQGALRRVEREVLEATEREQQRIGRDLHDSIQGSLVGMKMMLEVAKHSASAKSPELAGRLDEIMDIADQTLKQTRSLSRSLCPMELAGNGLARALERLAATTDSLFRVPCSFVCSDANRIEDEQAASQLYYISHEAVNNAIKHAKAKQIAIRLSCRPEGIDLWIEDDGVGISEVVCPTGGMGLRTMSYRAKMIGAKLSVSRGPGGGTVVQCRWQQQ